MHASRPVPDFPQNILHPAHVMQTAPPACGIPCLLDNLKIDMIYGRKKIDAYKNFQDIMLHFK